MEVVQYLKTPPSRERLTWLVEHLDGPVADLVRKDPFFKELGLDAADYTEPAAVVDLLRRAPAAHAAAAAGEGRSGRDRPPQGTRHRAASEPRTDAILAGSVRVAYARSVVGAVAAGRDGAGPPAPAEAPRRRALGRLGDHDRGPGPQRLDGGDDGRRLLVGRLPAWTDGRRPVTAACSRACGLGSSSRLVRSMREPGDELARGSRPGRSRRRRSPARRRRTGWRTSRCTRRPARPRRATGSAACCSSRR